MKAQTDSITMFMFSTGSFLEDDEFIGKSQNMQNLDVIYGDVSLRILSESNLIGLMDFKSVRVHDKCKMLRYTVSTAVDRFVRAVRESIRSVIFVYSPRSDILEMNLEYVGVLGTASGDRTHSCIFSPFRHLSLISYPCLAPSGVRCRTFICHLAFGLSGMLAVLLLCFILVCV